MIWAAPPVTSTGTLTHKWSISAWGSALSHDPRWIFIENKGHEEECRQTSIFSEIAGALTGKRLLPQRWELGNSDDHVEKIRDLRLLIVDTILITEPVNQVLLITYYSYHKMVSSLKKSEGKWLWQSRVFWYGSVLIYHLPGFWETDH